MKNNIVFHIPHSSLKIPKNAKKLWQISSKRLEKENKYLTDLYVDKLWKNRNVKTLRFGYSRMFCDTERYINDDEEVMSRYGMGYVYKNDSQGKPFFQPSKDYKKEIYSHYYLPFHQKIDEVVKHTCNVYGSCIFLDLHSFDERFLKDFFQISDTPDVCIGFQEIGYSELLIQEIKEFFMKCGYQVQYNFPYKGSFVPDICFGNKDLKLYSVMIEINKRIYLSDKKSYCKLKKDIQELITRISNLKL